MGIEQDLVAHASMSSTRELTRWTTACAAVTVWHVLDSITTLESPAQPVAESERAWSARVEEPNHAIVRQV